MNAASVMGLDPLNPEAAVSISSSAHPCDRDHKIFEVSNFVLAFLGDYGCAAGLCSPSLGEACWREWAGQGQGGTIGICRALVASVDLVKRACIGG